MTKKLDGISVESDLNYAICHVEFLSDDIKALIRRNLSEICHGSYISDHVGQSLFSYQTTLSSFIDRYRSKPNLTKMGMIGELVSHILITEVFDGFEVVSPFFNLEEKSIKKGFDFLLYRSSDTSIWITEVKSGNLHQDKTHDQTVRDLLNTAKLDLFTRLNADESMYWFNALHSVKCAVSQKMDYKAVLEEILINYGSAAADSKASSDEKCVVLVANLFEPLNTKVSKDTAGNFLNKITKSMTFSKVIVFCIQKQTFARVAEFLESEIAGAGT